MICAALRCTKRRRLTPKDSASQLLPFSSSILASAPSISNNPTRYISSFASSANSQSSKNGLNSRNCKSSTLRVLSTPLLSALNGFNLVHSTHSARLRTTPILQHNSRLQSTISTVTGTKELEISFDKLAPPPMNEVQVPLLSPHLRSQVFPPRTSPLCPPPPSQSAIDISVAHLTSHGLLGLPTVPKKDSKPIKIKKVEPAVDFLLPQLQGETILDHFLNISSQSAEPYLSLAKSFTTFSIPPIPEKESWSLLPGWTHYHIDGSFEPIAFPHLTSEVIVFDVETLPFVGGHFPVMAVAVGKDGWYGWCSPWLTGDSPIPNHLIPFDSPSTEREAKSTSPLSLFEELDTPPRLLIGHNVLFDRARVDTEYTLRRPSNRWLDTQSLHVAVSGLTSPQRPAWLWHKKEQKAKMVAKEGLPIPMKDPNEEPESEKWQDVSAMNSLAHVAKLHCNIDIDKSLVKVFIDPITTIEDVRLHFQDLIHYCALDVLTTHKVYQVLLPRFLTKCPHPASFSGILLMSQPILPVDARWPQYLERAETMYATRLNGVQDSLHILAEEARGKMSMKNSKTGRFVWEEDFWLRQLDWSPKRARRSPSALKIPSASPTLPVESIPSIVLPIWLKILQKAGQELVIPPFSPLAAVLLKVTWRSFPTYYSATFGWIFGVPKKKKSFGQLDKEHLIDNKELGLKDVAIKNLKGMNLYTVPISTGKKRAKLLVAKDFTNGLLASQYAAELKIAVKSNPSPSESVQLTTRLSELAHESIQGMSTKAGAIGAQDLVLRQLDWTPVDVSPVQSNKVPEISTPASDLYWPTWYHELDKPGKGLQVTTGKRASPLLLKLQWKGFPLAISKEFGWTFRIPLKEAFHVMAAEPSLKRVHFKNVADCDLQTDEEGVYVKLPHTDGEEKNVGNPLSKSFVAHFEAGTLSSEYATAKTALELNASCSYWASARDRITTQMVIWNGSALNLSPDPTTVDLDNPPLSTQGIILPQVTPMGTITRRAVERTWLTASNAKKNRVGSELKSMVRAPPGYAIVGADVDSEELWICSVMGDAQFGIHGATAIGWMTLEGTKSAGTDLHSKTASILGISRDDAKVFNYSRIYGAGVKHAVQLLLKADGKATKEGATVLAKNLYASTKGLVSRGAFGREFWHGGTESFVFNKLEEIAGSDLPLTPALGCGITDALTKKYLPKSGRDTFLPSRINWVVQSSGVDYLHLLLVSMEYLTKRFGIDARYMISVHDEVRYLVKEEDKYRAAMAMQISNLWTRALFSHRLQIADLPQSCAFFSAVDVDHCFRKEVNMTCITPSNPDSIPFGESLDISASLATTSDGSLFADGRSMKFENQLEQFSFSPEPISSADQHRVNNTPFLTAQTAKSPQAVGKLWKEVENQNPIKKVMKRSFDRPYQAVSSRSDHKLSQSDMREMQSHSTPRTFGPPKPFKLTGNQGAYLRRRFIPPPPIAPLVAATADQVKSLADWDEEEVPEDFSEFFSEDIVNNASV